MLVYLRKIRVPARIFLSQHWNSSLLIDCSVGISVNNVSTFENAKDTISFCLLAGVQRRKGRLHIIRLTFVLLDPYPFGISNFWLKWTLVSTFSGTSTLDLIWGYVPALLPDSICTSTKIIPDRVSVHAQERWFRYDFCDGGKLCRAFLKSGASHIG